jgi:hypothetical protein
VQSTLVKMEISLQHPLSHHLSPIYQPPIKASKDRSPKNLSLSRPSSAKNLGLEKRVSKEQPVEARKLPTAEELKAYEAYRERLKKMSLEELHEHMRNNHPGYGKLLLFFRYYIYLINGFTVFPKSVCYTDADDIVYELSLGNDEDEEGEEEETDEEEEETGAGAVEKEKA